MVVGLINPYTYKAITFIFTSFTDSLMHQYINELLPFSIQTDLGKQMAILILIVGLIYAFFREGKIRIRYICLFAGTVILGFMSYKAFSHFILVSLFPLAYFFKDMCPKDFSMLPAQFLKVYRFLVAGVSLVAIAALCYICVVDVPPKAVLKTESESALQVLKENFDPNNTTVYSSFNDGGAVEFYGFKPYIDPRAEVYLKINNKKDDIFAENYYVQMGYYSIDDFLEKYNFTHLLVRNSDILFNNLEGKNYFILYESTITGYRLYARNDLFSDKERQQIIDEYNKVIKQAQEEADAKQAWF